MKKVHKYTLEFVDEQQINLPGGAGILSVEEQHGKIVLYALVDTEEQRVNPRTVYIHGTGHEMYAKGLTFVGTVKVFDGALMYHVFVKGSL